MPPLSTGVRISYLSALKPEPLSAENTYPRISVVTTNFNNGAYLEDTIRSVLGQGYPNLEYIIIDGGSTDNSLEVIEKYRDQLSYFVSEPDQGQYYGIQKGFEQATGEIMAWLNSDDMYLPYSLFAVAEIMAQFPEVRWLTGHANEYTESGQVISRINLPWCRWSKHRYYTYDFQFIQQESTFWKRSLWEEAGSTLDLECKQAGDLELWARFFRYAQLHTTSASLAGFRHRKENQRSKDYKEAYFAEAIAVIRRERKKLSLAARMYYSCLRWPGYLMAPFFYYDIPVFRAPYWLIYQFPPVIHYDFSTHNYARKDKTVKLPPLLLGGKQFHRKSLKRNADG